MDYRNGLKIVKKALKGRKKVANNELIHLLEGDRNLFQNIKEDLLEEGGAVEVDMISLALPELVTQKDEAPEFTSIQKPYDLFLSYAHQDNSQSRAEELIQAIRNIHRKNHNDQLRIFFDREGIKTMDAWEHKIYTGLKQAKVMITLLSENYFTSQYCRKEWELFVEQEADNALFSEGIASLYAATYQELEKDIDQIQDQWLKDVKRRQYQDVRSWWERGLAQLPPEEQKVTENELKLLERQCYRKIKKVETQLASKSTIPPHNRNFVGRREKIRAIREQLALGAERSVVALQGLPGIGKSALAFEYAYLFSSEYPGGRYLVDAANMLDLKSSIIGLAADMCFKSEKRVELTEDDRRNPEEAFKKVRDAFQNGPKSLLLLDNIEKADFLTPTSIAEGLPQGENVHILATTRLDRKLIDHLSPIHLGQLSENEGLRLLEKYRFFESEAEKRAAQRIVAELDGYPLGLEVIGIYMKLNKQKTYQEYLEQLKQMNIAAVDAAGKYRGVHLSRHKEKIVSQLFEPTLDQLNEAEIHLLKYATLLPPDQVALPWLRELLAEDEVTLPQANPLDNPWQELIDRLKGLGILTETQEENIVRMHRVIQSVIKKRFQLKKYQAKLSFYIKVQARYMANNWHVQNTRWMIPPLIAYCELKIVDKTEVGADLVNYIFQLYSNLGRFKEGYELLISTKEIQENLYKFPDVNLGAYYGNLAVCESDLENYESSSQWSIKSLENYEQLYSPPHNKLGIGYFNLALSESNLGKLDSAKKNMNEALNNFENLTEPLPPSWSLDTIYKKFADIELKRNDLENALNWINKAFEVSDIGQNDDNNPKHAKRLMTRANILLRKHELKKAILDINCAIRIFEKIYADHPHPDLGDSYYTLAQVEISLTNFTNAQKWMEKAVYEQFTKIYESPHSTLGNLYFYMAYLEFKLKKLKNAIKYMEKAYHNFLLTLGNEHQDSQKALACLEQWKSL